MQKYTQLKGFDFCKQNHSLRHLNVVKIFCHCGKSGKSNKNNKI